METNFNNDDEIFTTYFKPVQTPEQFKLTKKFANEVIEVLSSSWEYKLLFTTFVNCYRKQFGHHLRLSHYGFKRLIELFEAIPNVVRIEEDPIFGKFVVLTEEEGLRVLGEQISLLISKSRKSLKVIRIARAYLREFGFALQPELFDCSSMLQLMEKLSGTVKVIDTFAGPIVQRVPKSRLQKLALKYRRILMDQRDHRVSVQEFERLYYEYYTLACNLNKVEKELTGVVKFTVVNGERFIELTDTSGTVAP